MPRLKELSYSQDVCVAAVSKYLTFLTEMYLDKDAVEWPPEGGWPTITADIFRGLKKSEKVISLLRHLPYIRRSEHSQFDQAQGAPWIVFFNWKDESNRGKLSSKKGRSLRVLTERYCWESVNSYTIGLLDSRNGEPFALLDTKHGVIYMPDCDEEIKDNTPQEQVMDDPYTWTPTAEADWRSSWPAWTITDFFEMLQQLYRELRFIPVDSKKVIDSYSGISDDGKVEPMIQTIFREHGWPNMEFYNKHLCLGAIDKMLQEHYPDFDPDP